MLKPAEETPLTAVLLGEVLARGRACPKASSNSCTVTDRHGRGAGARIPMPAKVSFTGSPPVGAHILQVAGLKRVTLELGNNSGTIVEPDADLDRPCRGA